MISARTSDHRALRDDHGNGVRRSRDRRRGGVTGAEPREEGRLAELDVDEPPSRDERPAVVDDERAVKLGELLDRLAQVGPVDVQELRGMAVERIEQERARPLEHRLDVTDDEQCPDLATLTALARDLDGELDDFLERRLALRIAAGARTDRSEDLLQLLAHRPSKRSGQPPPSRRGRPSEPGDEAHESVLPGGVRHTDVGMSPCVAS